MSEDDNPRPLNEPGYRKNAVETFLALLAASVRIAEHQRESAQPVQVRSDLQFRLRESPMLQGLNEQERQDLDNMAFFLGVALESEALRIVEEENPDDDSSH